MLEWSRGAEELGLAATVNRGMSAVGLVEKTISCTARCIAVRVGRHCNLPSAAVEAEGVAERMGRPSGEFDYRQNMRCYCTQKYCD